MGPIEAVSLSQSAGGIRDFIVTIILLLLNFWAVSKIITKAGYSAKWIVVPLTPVCLWFISLLVLILDARSLVVGDTTVSVPVSLGNFEALQILDVLSVVVTWVFFIIFAFSNWPVSASPRMPRASFTNQPTAFVPTGQVPVHTPASPPMPPPTHVPPNSAAAASSMPGTAQLPAPPTEVKRTTIFCSWCGKERAVDAQALHHCGSKERPVVYCMNCGTPFEAGASNCASCGTPTTQVSR
jgi:hypothetical protein